MSSVGLLILAAGGSRRLGSPKQLLRDGDGTSLIRRAARTALASRCRPVTVVLGASASVIRPELHDLPVTVVTNVDWQTGMASSLRVGLAALTAGILPDAAVVMLCDQPSVTPTLLDSLVSSYHATGAQIVASEYGGILGVPALFGQDLFDRLKALQGDEGARRVIKEYSGPIAQVAFPEGQFDIDTTEDAERLGAQTGAPEV